MFYTLNGGVTVLRNQGKDTTLEPAYFAKKPKLASSSADIEKLIEALEELQLIVKGSAGEGYGDGLVNRVEVLEQQIKDIQIQSKYHIYYDTTANWNNQPTLISEEGSIYIYSDGKVYINDNQESVVIPRIKIGDGNAYLIDKPFIDTDIREKLEVLISITQQDIDRWNGKIGAKISDVDAENLILYNEVNNYGN